MSGKVHIGFDGYLYPRITLGPLYAEQYGRLLLQLLPYSVLDNKHIKDAAIRTVCGISAIFHHIPAQQLSFHYAMNLT
ncbi:hypothetical protein APC39_15460 [Acinetobacter pittii]|nr:hypothetical protein APC39_15460 [Acinetobacter pittii]